jgi:hypothetical protein
MAAETLDLATIERPPFEAMDSTGGSPELNPGFDA